MIKEFDEIRLLVELETTDSLDTSIKVSLPVGSAYGDAGIWSRWACYIGTGHGWNDELTKLINTNGIVYARENFQFSILEFRSMRTDDQVIINREQYWKRALQTNAFGYNKN